MRRSLLAASLAALILTPTASAADTHRGQIEIASWSLSTSSAHYGGTGKTMAAEVLASAPVD